MLKYICKGNSGRHYCAPTAISGLTGLPVEDVEDTIRKLATTTTIRRNGDIIGVSCEDSLRVLQELTTVLCATRARHSYTRMAYIPGVNTVVEQSWKEWRKGKTGRWFIVTGGCSRAHAIAVNLDSNTMLDACITKRECVSINSKARNMGNRHVLVAIKVL